LTEHWPNTTVCVNAADARFLWQVLERELTPQKYYLSAIACAGILRRAQKRGKKLPELLRLALTTQIARSASAAATRAARSSGPPV
jgi:DNA (cytosine-5)-methyltransferase 1